MPLYQPGNILSSYMHGTDGNCACCEEFVGQDDSLAIVEQLQNREKTCMWCGDDFDLTEEEIGHVLADNTDDMDIVAARLNEASHIAINDKFFDIEVNNGGMDESGIIWMKKDVYNKKEFEKQKKRAIKMRFGIDTDEEKFDPGYADEHGNPRDRINDAIPYEEIHAKGLAYRILKYVEANPKCTAADIKRNVKLNRKAVFSRLEEAPTSRLHASKLIDCDSTFTGFVDMSSMAARFPVGYLGKIPRFSRKYFITPHGEGVLAELENGRKEVLI